MNKGIALANGDFIYFLGADDYLIDGNVLRDIATFLDGHPDTDFVYGGLQVRLPDGRAAEFLPPAAAEALDFMLVGCLPHQASFASRRAFDIAGTFDIRYRIAGDYDWFLRVLTSPQLVTRHIGRIVASYRMDGVSNRLAESQCEAYAIQNSLPLFQERDWVKRRLRVFRRELLSQRCRAAALPQSRRAYLRLGIAVALARALVGDLTLRLLLAGPARKQRLLVLEQAVLAQRIANDALEWRSPP